VLVSIVVEVFMLGLLLTNSMRLLNQTLEEQTQAKVEAIAPLLDSALSARLFERDHVGISEILNKLMKNQYSSFQYIVIYDSRGEIYARSGEIDTQHMPALNQHVSASISKGVYNTFTPLTLGNEVIGEVRFGLSLQSLINSRDNVIQQGLIIASIEVMLTFLLLSLIGYWLTRHIHTLMSATQQVSEGNHTIQIPVTGGDEIALLSSNFNIMTRAIHDRIDALHHSEQALFEEKERAEITLHSIGDGVITTNAYGLIEYMNPAAELITGWEPSQAKGRHVIEVYRTLDELTLTPINHPVSECLQECTVISQQSRSILVRKDGKKFAVEDTAAPILDHNGEVMGAVLVFHDVTTSREFARQLEYQATHDALTGLVNRREFERLTQEALQDAREHNASHAMCYLDLDQFKIVNDTCGHSAGDELLRQLSQVMAIKMRDLHILGRLGGDEFGLLIKKCSITEATHVAEEIREKIKEFRFTWNEKMFEIGVSIGVVLIRPDSSDISEIFSTADVACYIAKDKGRNQIHVYQVDDIEHARRQGEMQWSTRVTDALKENRFVLYYQKIVPLASTADSLEKCELLVRMIDYDGKIIPPVKFIGAAERYHLIMDLDRWVVRKALSLISQPESQAICNGIFSINLSGESIGNSEFLEFVSREIRSSKVPPSKICFEVTETAAISNLSRASQFITELKVLGCKFSLDDFGSGLSSFAYLKALPIDYLKIDGAFVRNIAKDSNDRAMVTAINQVGHALGISTIAEFIENHEIQSILEDIGVNMGQGYFIHMPKEFKLIGQSHIVDLSS